MSTSLTEVNFRVKGMDCAGCARSVETGVGQMAGVQVCELNFTTERLQVVGEVSSEAVAARVRELGFDVVESHTRALQPTSSHRNFWQFLWQRFETRSALLGALLILPGLLFEELLAWHHPLVDLTSVGAMIAAGWPIARSAWRSLRINREININVLMTIASIGAVIIGAYTEAGMVMVLFAIGEALEGFTADQARNALRSLMEVAPNQAVRLKEVDGQILELEVPVEELLVGDRIVVKPGERIPMDGRVLAGASAVNQAPITGESRLIEKTVGSEVFASSINGEGMLELEVTHLAENNTISRLIHMVEEAQEKRAPAQRFVDQFARYYTPTVVVLAALVAIIPPLFFRQPFFNAADGSFGWLYRGLALLVVACPCALVISTPVSIISAISNGARRGVLIKGGAYLEILNRVKTVAFDKTGTLTLGRPTVVSVRAAACQTDDRTVNDRCIECDEIVALAGAVERRSEHPLARAILTESSQRGVYDRYQAAEMVTALTGRGVTGQVDGREVVVGSHAYFEDRFPHTAIHCDEAGEAAMLGQTPLMVGVEGAYLGMITVADAVRETSREAIEQLRSGGLEHIVMLTGDHQATAQAVGEQVGVTEVRSDLLPEHKVRAVEALQQQYGPVAMVGDGINDAPALATATVGIAIGGASGTTQAMETADITLMSEDLRQLPFVFKLSRATMRTIWVNILFSIGIKLVFVVLVLLGLGTMWMAVLADMATSLLVTLNGMRLLRQPDSPVGRN